MASARRRGDTLILLALLAWLVLPYVLVRATGAFVGEREFVIWAAVGLIGFAAVRVRKRNLRQR